MTTMDQIHHIRELYYEQDKNLSEIAAITGFNRKTVSKYVDMTDFNPPSPKSAKSCQEFADRMGWTIIREEQENGISGFKVHAADRDKIQLIKEHARDGKFDILLVFMFDRIGRIAAETPFVVEELVQSGIRVGV